MANIWFSSDYHFNHGNILQYDSRPWKTVSEHNEALIANHNTLVKSEDTVYYLGDFGMKGNADDWLKIRRRMNGNIFGLRGNHDKQFSPTMFGWYKDYYEITIEGILVVMCHYPILSWNRQRRGSIHLSGHTHSKDKIVLPGYRGIHVGVTSWDYKPVSWDQIKKLAESIEPKDYRPRD